MLTLSDALATNRLQEFVAQAEAAGIGNADAAAFDQIVKRVTAPLPSGRTSRSPARGGSAEK